MIIKFAAFAATAMLLLATPGSAQTATESLQKGIYTQETAGDVDGAIQIYRGVIASAGADRATAGRAQMQLVGAFLQKGDFAGASREFNTLVLSYSDQKEMLSSVVAAMRLAARMGLARPLAASGQAPQLTLGTLQNGIYHHTKTGTEIALPPGVSVTDDSASSGGGEAVLLNDSAGLSYFVWIKADDVAATEIPAKLEGDMAYKIHQRTVDGAQGFQVRPGTELKYAPGNAAQAVAVAFDIGKDGAQVEYDVFARTGKTQVYYRCICPANMVGVAQDRMQILVRATTIP